MVVANLLFAVRLRENDDGTPRPNQPVALHVLGVIARPVGKNMIAIELITKALAIKTNDAEDQTAATRIRI